MIYDINVFNEKRLPQQGQPESVFSCGITKLPCEVNQLFAYNQFSALCIFFIQSNPQLAVNY